MKYRERLDKLYFEAKTDVLSTVDNGYFPEPSKDGVSEFSNFVKLFMKKWDIGSYLSKDKWGIRRVNQMRQILYNIIRPPNDKPVNTVEPPKSALQVYDDLKKDVKGKQFTNYDFERVARTETARLKATFQLLGFKEEGVKYVIHKTRNDNKVSQQCKLHANREYKIDDLLNDESKRIPIHVNCFTKSSTPIFTSKGWKNIKNIKVGDLVLTHKGRFKHVTNLIFTKKWQGEYVEILFSYKYNKNTSTFFSINVTKDHPIMTSAGWKNAKDLKKHDKIIMLADICDCGESFPYFNSQTGGYIFCSSNCSSKYTALSQWYRQKNDKNFMLNFKKKISDDTKKSYIDGRRDKFKQTENARKGVFKKIFEKGYLIPFENRRSGDKAIVKIPGVLEKIKLKTCNNGKNFRNTKHEIIFENILKKLSENYIYQYRICREKAVGFPPKPELVYIVDFYLKEYNLIIEIDGAFKNSEKDKIRQKWLIDNGYKLIRIMNDQVEVLNELIAKNKYNNIFDLINESSNIIKNHRGQYKFIKYEIEDVNIKKSIRKQMIYNFSVEDDESYIANGVVVHNCRCRYTLSMKGLGDDEE